MAAVEIVPEAGKFAIEYHLVNQKVSYSVNGGILTLNAEDAGGINISYNENSYVKIYVPEGSVFTDIDCKCNVGDIRIGKMKADNVKIDANVGNVTLTDAYVAKKLAIEAAVGNVDVEIAAADCSYDISTDVGKIVINGTQFSGMGVKKVHNSPYGPHVKISAGTGDISFRY